MYAVVGIYFEKANTLEYYAPNTTSLTIGQYVVVESKRGHELGVVRHARERYQSKTSHCH
ncbi:Signal peptidase-like protein [Staphylococcus pseudintermedius]|nr:Signal peptidase-like protein [Staphylococcus pseudintermedius]